jgi:chromosome partitioning protein
VALPYIVLRNDQQDALSAGLAVTEYALEGEAAEEIRSLWLWVWKKLTLGSTAYAQPEMRAANQSLSA